MLENVEELKVEQLLLDKFSANPTLKVMLSLRRALSISAHLAVRFRRALCQMHVSTSRHGLNRPVVRLLHAGWRDDEASPPQC